MEFQFALNFFIFKKPTTVTSRTGIIVSQIFFKSLQEHILIVTYLTMVTSDKITSVKCLMQIEMLPLKTKASE